MSSLSMLIAGVLGVGISYIVYTSLFSPLASIPGPFLAKYTDLWRLLSCLGRQPEVIQRRLHDELGPVVRLGPNLVSISDPSMVSDIYSRQKVLIKGDFYKVHDLNINGQRSETIFSARDEKRNTAFLRPVTKLYSMGHIIKLEPRIDSTINSFLDHLTKRFAQTSQPCEMHKWLQYVAWDVIFEITFGEPLGFMDQNKDVENMLSIMDSIQDYASIVGMMPWLDNFLDRNPVIRIGAPAFGSLVNYCVSRLTGRASGSDGHDPDKLDMLDGFFEARKASPDEVQEEALMAYVATNVGAGADTVAAELRSIVYHLCKRPEALKKLQAELDSVKSTGSISWAQCKDLLYLGACVSEGCRILPGVGLPLERRVGPNGLALPDGKTVLPPNTTVGINPYVINRDRGVFGEDAHVFRPERWLQSAGETDEVFSARLSQMRKADFTFGSGKRACTGRNIALIECYKIIASLVKTFDLELVHPEREWKTHNAFLMRQSDMDVKLKRRGQ